MATVVDTLKILVEADSRGIESVLKRVMQNVTGTINDINKQEVNWTSIFSRAVSPAIISSIAALFAMAIQQSAGFQQAMTDAGTAVGMNSDQIGMLGEQTKKMTSTVAVSSKDAGTALAQMGLIFGKNSDSAYNVAEAIGQLSSAGFGEMNELIQTSTQLFRTWGITTENEALGALTSLLHAAQATGLEIPSLVQEFMKFSPALRASGFGAKDLNQILSGFATTINSTGLGSASELFGKLADTASKAGGPLIVFGVGIDKARQSLMEDGGLSALKQAADRFDAMGAAGVNVAESMGLSKDAIGGLANIAQISLGELIRKQTEVASNAKTIEQAYQDSMTALKEWQLLWNQFSSMVSSSGLADAFGAIAKVIRTTVLPAIGDLFTKWKESFDGITNFLGGAIFWFGQLVEKSEVLSGAFKTIKEFLKDIDGPMNSFAKALNGGSLNFASVFLPSSVSSGFGALEGLANSSAAPSIQGLFQSLISAITGSRGNQNTISNTFNLSVPAGGSLLKASDISKSMYDMFQGTYANVQ